MTANHRPLEEGDIELIDRVRASPCLYDTKDPNFRLVYKKEEEWQAIADSMAMSPWEARKRWTVLRDRYARELKQLILHPESTEYGKNDFFLRMDFIRNFVKKREVKRKRSTSQSSTPQREEKIKFVVEKPRSIKIYKVTGGGVSAGGETSNSETDEKHNIDRIAQKTYVIDDSQDYSMGKYSYMDQASQESQEHVVSHDDTSHHLEEQSADQEEYNDYVEDTSAAFEAVEEDTETITQDVNNSYSLDSTAGSSTNVIIKPEHTKIIDNFNITMVDKKLAELPNLQERPNLTNTSLDTTTSSLQVDTEEYFSKTIASYLRLLAPRYKIKAKVEMMQIIEKFIDLQESKSQTG